MMNIEMPKTRNAAIDILKLVATLAIFNHLSGSLYGRWSFLGTGGALGITLFFFISGFTLYLGRLDRFDSWYKRRLSRVWPTAFVAVAVGAIITGRVGDVLGAFSGAGWFVQNILIAYIVLYFVRFFKIPVRMAFACSIIVACIWYFVVFDHSSYGLFGGNSMRTVALYPFLFMGALTANHQDRIRVKPPVALVIAASCFICFNAVVFLFVKNRLDCRYQLILLAVQLVLVFMLYCAVRDIHVAKKTNSIMLFIGGLCLEMYLTYGLVRTTYFNALFPLNIVINLGLGLAFAYFIRCLARIFQQTFQKEPYDWRAVFALI